MPRDTISIVQGRVFGLNSRPKVPINTRPKVNHYEYMGI